MLRTGIRALDKLKLTGKSVMKKLAFGLLILGTISAFTVPNQVCSQQPTLHTEIEGISEYRLENGVQLLLFPDNSKPTVTVNMTVLVGSRNEGYGETGMAHLLEHMLFKGTPTHKDIPKLLKDRGAIDMNGTTWVDRTNYYETLPASDDNLEFAIRFEADRLVNSLIDANELAREMTVVRNEFEMGENSPFGILRQRMMAVAYEWHNYGKSTIGNRSDIERVPVVNLRKFYERFYQPDNISLVIAGKFDAEKALDWVQEYFGVLEAPKDRGDGTWTEEPAQDGERNVVLRRVGDVPVAGVIYHIPAAAHPEFAATEVLGNILGQEPGGRLYKALVEPGLFSSISAGGMATHDPGTMIAMGQVSEDTKPEVALAALLKALENLGEFSDEEVQRSIQDLLKSREDLLADSQALAIELSEWTAYGDWRLFFLHRDRLEKVTPSDVAAVAAKYLRRDNRTTGLFIPVEEVERIAVPSTPSIDAMVADYKGRASMAEGEEFDPTPENIAAKMSSGELDCGIKYSVLPRKTRGETVVLKMALRFGNDQSLAGMATACEMLSTVMMHGAGDMDYQQLKDYLDANRISLKLASEPGVLDVTIETRREYLDEAIDVLGKVLRQPLMPEDQFEISRREMIANLKNGISDPQMLAINRFQRELNPQPSDDIRYIPTIEESIQRAGSLTLDEIKQVHQQFLGASNGELAIAGDFDARQTLEQLDGVLSGWKSSEPYHRIENVANTDVAGQRIIIETPDKANALFVAGLSDKFRDDDPDYEAMVLANYIMGGGGLSSRLANRVRQQDGLSYGVGSNFRADDMDPVAMFVIFAISAPDNTEKVVNAVQEEVQRFLDSGVTGEELTAARDSYLETIQGNRADNGNLASLLRSQLQSSRNMDFVSARENRYRNLTKDQVDAAMRRIVDPQRLVVVTAGDFAKVKSRSAESDNDAPKSDDESDKGK